MQYRFKEQHSCSENRHTTLIDLAISTNTHSAQSQFLVHNVQLQRVQVLALIIVDNGNISFTFWQLEKRKLTFNHFRQVL